MAIVNPQEFLSIINGTDDNITKKIYDVYNSNDCSLDSSINGVELKELCLSDNNYDDMKLFIENNDVEKLRHLIDNFSFNSIDSKESETKIKKYELIMILSIFKKIKLMEDDCHNYWHESSQYYKQLNTYKICMKEGQLVTDIHEFNIKSDDDKNESDYIPFLKNVLTPDKMKHELLKYELLNYIPKNKIYFDKQHLETIAQDIKHVLDRFNPIIQSCLEDHEWTINYDNTMNFAVPSNKIIFSNTISMNDAKNEIVIQHLNMVSHYINNMFKISSGKYVIVDDNKYKFSWILISVGYFK